MAFRGSGLGTCSQRSLPSAATGLTRWSLKARGFLGTALACGLAFVACQPPEDLWHLDAPLGALRTPPPGSVLRVTYKVSHGVRVAMASIEEVWRFGSYWDEEGTWALQEPPKYLGLSTSAIGKGNTGDVYVLPDLLLQRLYTGGPEDELPPGAFAGIVETKVMPIWERTARWSPKDVQQEVRPSDARNVYPTQQETLQVKASHQPRAVLSCPSKPIRELFTSDSGSTPEDYRYTFYLPEDVYDRPGCEVRVFLVGLCPGEVPCEPPASSVLEMERATAMDVTDGSIPKSKGTDTGADSSCTAEDAGAAASDADASCAPTKFP